MTTFTLYEDDGLTRRHCGGDYAELECALQWTPSAVRLRVGKRGRYALPYSLLPIVLPASEQRPLRLEQEGISLAPHRAVGSTRA